MCANGKAKWEKTEKGRKRGTGQYRRLFEVLKKCCLNRVWEFNFVSTYSTCRPLGKTEENSVQYLRRMGTPGNGPPMKAIANRVYKETNILKEWNMIATSKGKKKLQVKY